MKIYLNISEDLKEELIKHYYNYLTNNYDVYRQQRQPIDKSLENKILKNKYDHQKALKAFYNLAYMQKKRYLNDMKNNEFFNNMFGNISNLSKDIIDNVAIKLRENFELHYL